MNKTFTRIAAGTIVAAAALVAVPATQAQDKVTGWGDFKIYLDPGHSAHENQGLWGYSEAEKTVRVALNIQDMFYTLTDMPQECLKICRYDDNTVVDLSDRTAEANAWGADFYYSIHSDAGATNNSIVTLFGGWRKDGVEIEKTPNGGKAYGELLDPNLSGVMRVDSRGNWYDRCFYYRGDQTHENQYPYLHVNRVSTMPSLLSEGGYHTLAEQQQRNMNDDYKRLEAFAAFQSLMLYHGMTLPSQTFLTGVVTNSENGQPLNGATITVDGKTYTTDSFESLFSKYTRNENLIHNGFYFFEGLEAGKEYTVEFACPGFETAKETVTIVAGGEHSADYVTFCDMALTNSAPAKVDAVSANDLSAVKAIEPLVLTFSRNMDRASVEEAFSINHNGEVTLSWDNDYTLAIDVANLLPEWDYTIIIKGDVARNSQTNQKLDGDGDGVEGGDFVLDFTMAEPDVEAPYVEATYPEDNGEALYMFNAPIRLQFNEEIQFNEDKNGGCIVVTDAAGNEYPGKITHAVINGHSVLHFLTETPYPEDSAILVVVNAGLLDLSGNASEPYAFRFLTEYRPITSNTVLMPMVDEGSFWAPNGSGSSKGWTDEGNETTKMYATPFADGSTSMAVKYSFDELDSDEVWQLRIHDPKAISNSIITEKGGIVTMWIYGDLSNNEFFLLIRDQATNALVKPVNTMTVDFAGWNLYAWDLEGEEKAEYLTSNGFSDFGWTDRRGNPNSKPCWPEALFIKHYYTDPDDEDVPFQAWTGEMGFNTLSYTILGEGERKANIEDVALPNFDGLKEVAAAGIQTRVNRGVITVSADETLRGVAVYDLSGRMVARHQGGSKVVTLSIQNLPAGVYVVTANGVASKFVK